MRTIPLLSFLALFHPALAEQDPFDPFGDPVPSKAEETAAEEKLYLGIEAAHQQYRRDFAEILRKADKVEIYIVAFDRVYDEDFFKDQEQIIRVAPYGRYTPIIQTKVLDKHEREILLEEVARQIAKPDHGGGALCHGPVHGMRAFIGDRVVFESTFCWVCGNFGFEYPASVSPENSIWLDTTNELADTFSKILPIPKTELDRFHKLHPNLKPEK